MTTYSDHASWSIDDLQSTWQLVSRLHDGQKYGGPGQGEKVEYINHIGSVGFEILKALEHTPHMNARLALSCALLHDSLEDTPFPEARLRELFGDAVAEGVKALTKNEALEGKREKMMDSLRRIRLQPVEVWAVKLADRICNLYAPPYYWSRDKKLAYLEEARLILRELKEGNAYLAARLAQKISDYQRFLP